MTPRDPMRPPAAAERLLRRMLPEEDRASFAGEMAEMYRARVEKDGDFRARIWYRLQVTELAVRLLFGLVRRGRRKSLVSSDEGPSTRSVGSTFDAARRDLKMAVRGLGRRPGFAAIAILSLALGIGANTAMFSLVNAALLRPAPLTSPDRWVEVYTSDSDGNPYATFSHPDFTDLSNESSSVFDEVIGYELFFAVTERGDASELVMGEAVTGNYFTAVGAPLSRGRAFTPSQDVGEGEHPVAVLSHSYWQDQFRGEPDVIGATVRLNSLPYTVIGVADASYRGLTPGLVPDVWVPMTMVDQVRPGELSRTVSRGSRSTLVKARLQEGVDPEQAQDFLSSFSARLAEAYPDTNEGRQMTLVPTRSVSIHPAIDRALVPVAVLLLSVVGLVLVITCANLAGFLLARAEESGRDVAVLLALGSSRGAIVRRFLTEALLLSIIGGALGVVLAIGLIDVLLSFQPPIPVPVNLDVGLDRRVLLFAFGVTTVAGIAVGMTPAFRAAGHDVASRLRVGGGAGGGPAGSRVRRGLVVAQVALACVLMLGSGLFLRSLLAARSVDPGFYTGAAAIIWPDLRLSGIPDEEGPAAWDDLRSELLDHAAIDRVAIVGALPLGVAIQTTEVEVPDHPSDRPDGRQTIDQTAVGPEYFDVMEVPIVSGQLFERTTPEGWDGSVIVSRAFERRFFPNGAVGQVLNPGRDRPLTIVGVAEDTKVRTLGESPRPRLYFPHGYTYIESLSVVVRGAGTSAELLSAVRATVDRVFPRLVLFEAKTMESHLAVMLFAPRMGAVLISAFGLLALLIAAIGIYGVVSYAAARRSHEMGVRLSLGATPGSVSRLVVRGGLIMVGIGGAIGLVLATLLGSALSPFLIGISGRDFMTFALIPVLLLLVGLVASAAPALRTIRLDPSEVLRSE